MTHESSDTGLTTALRIYMTALAWGLAEATLFFIVPDVLLSWLALNQPRRAWVGCFWAVAGAVIGGGIMYAWGAFDPAAAMAMLDRVPEISLAMCQTVRDQLHEHGVIATFIGPFTGKPYKIYAVQAGTIGLNPLMFLLISVPARLSRFMLITGTTRLLSRAPGRTSLLTRRIILASIWTAFYAWLFLWQLRD